MSDTATDPPPTDPSGGNNPLSGAAERLRQSARWFVVAFGAVAAAVFAGVSVSDFGDVRWDTGAFWIAVTAAVVALVATLAAMLMAMSLAAASTVSVDELRSTGAVGKDRALAAAVQILAKDPALATWKGSLPDFFTAIDDANNSYQQQLTAWRNDSALQASDVMVRRSVRCLQALSLVQTEVMNSASYLRLRGRFSRADRLMALALAFAAAGTLVFSIITRQAAAADIPTKAVAATWNVPVYEQAELAGLRGVHCDETTSALPVILLDETSSGKHDILVLPTANCAVVRLSVGQGELTLPG